MYKRSQLAAAIREALAPTVLQGPKECKVITITEVELTPDAQFATVYLSALQSPEIALEYMQKRKKSLQFLLRSLPKKRIPTLRFVLDSRVIQGNRIDTLLQAEQDQLDN